MGLKSILLAAAEDSNAIPASETYCSITCLAFFELDFCWMSTSMALLSSLNLWFVWRTLSFGMTPV